MINFCTKEMITRGRVTILNCLPDIGKEETVKNILAGLTAPRKYISSMYFYDKKGSELFEAITRLPEYYLTSTEKGLLNKVLPEVARPLEHNDIVEFGSGDCSKISLLFEAMASDALRTVRYIPVDVSQAAIEKSAEELARTFPELDVYGIAADFTRQLHLIPEERRRLFCFFGSTLGNFEKNEADTFFTRLGRIMRPGEMLVLGVDMVKPAHVLERAYNDSRHVTAGFNRNILTVVNNIAGTDFCPDSFSHDAFYNERKSRIEMHLTATKDITVTCPYLERPVRLKRGDRIHTENSHKFTKERIRALGGIAGLKPVSYYTDSRGWFSLNILEKE